MSAKGPAPPPPSEQRPSCKDLEYAGIGKKSEMQTHHGTYSWHDATRSPQPIHGLGHS